MELAKQLDNNFLRTVPGTTIHKYAYKEFFKHYEWRQALFIAQAGAQAYDSYQNQVRLVLMFGKKWDFPCPSVARFFTIVTSGIFNYPGPRISAKGSVRSSFIML